MTKTLEYETALGRLPAHDETAWDEYLMRESGLPGPRGNLELADAFARVAPEQRMVRYAALDAGVAPVNTPGEYLAFCGVLGFGRLAAEGKRARLADLKRAASDPRWRLREAAARALLILGDADLPALLAVADDWCGGSRLEQRAALAGVCEPRLLKDPAAARAVLAMVDRVTASIADAADGASPEFRVLRQGLGYCWSVAVAALPADGKPAMEKWLASADPHVRWVMRENLSKARLERADPEWVARWKARLR